MALLAEKYNTYISTSNIKSSSVYVDKAAYVVLANSSALVNRYPEYLNQIREIEVGGTFLRNDPAFCEILTKEYSKPRVNSLGDAMDFNKFEVIDNRSDINLSLNDIRFISEYNMCENIKQIYIFKEKNYTEFWFEINDTDIEAEDDIFYKYSLFKKVSDSTIKIITFSEDELYENTNIDYDMLLRRKG